jgi:aspartyl-tRNA(Asn)/glutamyl-tRNA(Gln) amidotransferase subunit C
VESGGGNDSAPATHQPAILPYNLNAICRKSTQKCIGSACKLSGNRPLLPAISQNFKFFINVTIKPRAALSAPFAMSLTLSDVTRIAKLAQLEMSEQQSATALEQLNGIFALAEQMQAVDTDGVAPLSHPLAAHMNNIALRLREDAATEANRREDYQAVAPKTQDGLYLVPKVIE